MSNYIVTANEQSERAVTGSAIWTKDYFRHAAIFVFIIAALQVGFGGDLTPGYAALSLMFPLLWVLAPGTP